MPYLLSIIVPTKNRYHYLKHLINLIVSFKSPDIELIIQDNSDDNAEIENFLKEKPHENIKYFYNSKWLSSVQNFDKAVLNSSGEYVCFIGDDDGVCRNIVDCVRWMKVNDIEALRSSKIYYFWANKGNKLNGSILYPKFSNTFHILDAMKELKLQLKKGLTDVDPLPSVYSGIVRRDVLDKVYSIGNTFFPGATADIASGVSLCFYLKKFVKINIPVIIGGSSSDTGGGIANKGLVELSSVNFISKKVIDGWEKRIPPIWVGLSAWSDSGINALKYTGHDDLINKVNFNYLLASCIIQYNGFLKYGVSYSKNKAILFIYVICLLFLKYYRKVLNRCIRFSNSSNKIGANTYIITGVDSIESAEKILFAAYANMDFNKLMAK